MPWNGICQIMIKICFREQNLMTDAWVGVVGVLSGAVLGIVGT